MIYRYLAFPVLLLVLLGGSCREERGKKSSVAPIAQLNLDANAPGDQEVKIHPKSIEGLRTRGFSAVNLTILAEVPTALASAAWMFSYESEGFTNYGLIEGPAGDAPDGGWPVIILAHGYIPPENYSTTRNYRLVTRHYAEGGFIVVKPDYRGHGNSEGRASRSARTIDYTIDVLNLVAGLGEIPGADPDNVFLYGHSMGGEIALRILTVTDTVRGASLWAAVTESFPENTLYFIRKRDAAEAETLQAAVDAEFAPEDYPLLTPNSYLDSISVPLLVHHGTDDESVPFEWSVPFRAQLDAAGVAYTFFEYPEEDHNISDSFYEVLDKDMEFFRSLIDK